MKALKQEHWGRSRYRKYFLLIKSWQPTGANVTGKDRSCWHHNPWCFSGDNYNHSPHPNGPWKLSQHHFRRFFQHYFGTVISGGLCCFRKVEEKKVVITEDRYLGCTLQQNPSQRIRKRKLKNFQPIEGKRPMHRPFGAPRERVDPLNGTVTATCQIPGTINVYGWPPTEGWRRVEALGSALKALAWKPTIFCTVFGCLKSPCTRKMWSEWKAKEKARKTINDLLAHVLLEKLASKLNGVFGHGLPTNFTEDCIEFISASSCWWTSNIFFFFMWLRFKHVRGAESTRVSLDLFIDL